MKVQLKNIIICLLLGVYVLTTSISRIEVFKIALCSPKTINKESSSSKPLKIEQKLWWNLRRHTTHSVKAELPSAEITLTTEIPTRECISFVLPSFECNYLTEYHFSDSSPRSPPLS
ncbi:MAG: hypothetical protein HY960_00820 [Ignavibacteriae bacterium]|nr:hypothetical protein [Ignavibacteriota bacterium]